MELGPEDVSLLERCPHFRGCYVQASMELGPEDVCIGLSAHITGGCSDVVAPYEDLGESVVLLQ